MTIARKQIVGVGLAAAFLASIVLYLFFPPHALWPRREKQRWLHVSGDIRALFSKSFL